GRSGNVPTTQHSAVFHDHGGDHAEHAFFAFDVGEDVAMPHPGSDPVGTGQHRVALTGGNVDGVGPVRLLERNTVLGKDQLGELMQVHGVDLQSLVVVVDGNPLPRLDHVRLGGGEGLAVERQADGAGVVEHHR